MSLGQGVAMILAGVAAQHYAPATVIAASGTIGLIAAAAITLGFRPLQPSRPGSS